jgi:hypothetical protein
MDAPRLYTYSRSRNAWFPQGEIVKARNSDRVEFVSCKFHSVAAELKLSLQGKNITAGSAKAKA